MKSKSYALFIPFLVLAVALCVAFKGLATSDKLADSNLYVALGDSVAAGIGLQTPSPDSEGCKRTQEAYANFVANATGFELENVACSGATIAKGLLGQQKLDKTTKEPQIEQLANLPKPKLITITIGANDINWTEPLTRCFATTCGSLLDTRDISNRLYELKVDLEEMLDEVSSLYKNEPPQVVLTTYYSLFPADITECAAITTDKITPDEISWLNTQFTNLNNTIATSAKNYPFAKVVSLNFENHSLCSADSWIQGLDSSAPLHPTAAGQQAIAAEIVKNL